MAYSQTGQSRQQRQGGAAGYATPSAERAARTGSGGCSCGCAEADAGHTCCDLICFERPEYFCGHLLTDTDLSLDQRYVREKHKLHNRTLHGHGIVCGLRLTCDPECRGHVLVEEGYGIDDCGNDLVVCEAMSLDVIGRLRDKKLLYDTGPQDDCGPTTADPDCRIRQCFYVTACYDEEPQEFETPLGPACGPAPHVCEPTRIRETVRLDVVDGLPRPDDPLRDLECRIEHCFSLFTEGPFAEELRKPVLQVLADGKADPGQPHKQYCDAVCRLRVLLKLYLEGHPDHYNCTAREDLDAVVCPAGPDDAGFRRDTYGGDFRTAVCRVLDVAYAYVAACVLGELTVPCTTPSSASCLVLGTVEVEGSRVIRVCNCPRSYVWSFASLFPSLIATLFGRYACEELDPAANRLGGDAYADEEGDTGGGGHVHGHGCGCHDKDGPRVCCRALEPREGCAALLRNLSETRGAIAGVGTAAIDVIRSVSGSLRFFLDPTRTDVTLLGALRGSSSAEAEAFLARKGVDVTVVSEAPTAPLKPVDAFTALLHYAAAPGDRVVLQETKSAKGNLVVEARPELLEERVKRMELELADLKRQIYGEDEGGGSGPSVTGQQPGPGRRRPRRREGGN